MINDSKRGLVMSRDRVEMVGRPPFKYLRGDDNDTGYDEDMSEATESESGTNGANQSRRHDRAINRVGDRLTYATAYAQDQLRAYRDFQRTRGRWDEKPLAKERWVVRGAHSPESHIMTFSILAGLILFEGLANAYFFSKGSDLGLLGGWIQAITVAFTNVIAAFFLVGFLGIRMLQNPDRPFSFALAAVGVPVAVLFIVFLNFTAAHYRDLLELNAATLALGDLEGTGEILAPVTRALTFQPVETLEALLLLILGVTFAAIAAFKGATFDDRLMGYGAIQRRYNRALASLEQALKQVKPEVRADAAGQAYDDPRYGVISLAMHVKSKMIDYKLDLEDLGEERLSVDPAAYSAQAGAEPAQSSGSNVPPPLPR